MSGEAFGLGVDLLSAKPRTWCPDCSARLLWGADALDAFAASAMPPDDRALLAEMSADGGNFYACPRCGLFGAFSGFLSF